VTELKMRTLASAKPNSLSERYGCGSFPFHTDFAFRAIPPRFILLSNETNIHFERQTYISRFIDLPSAMLDLLLKSSWRLLSSGHHYLVQSSFVLDRERGLRWDRDFLNPANAEALEATRVLNSAMLGRSSQVDWRPSSAVLIDNWRCAHARGGQLETDIYDANRKLTRTEFWTHARMVI
jgi:L-asparagine oxygenase